MELTLLTDAEALRVTEEPDFRNDWIALCGRCPWATVCQHPDFVLPWYRLYADTFLPVVVLARSARGELRGLLTLARRRGSVRMTGAGECQAEYQAWLAAPGDGDDFMRAALAQLRAGFPGVELRLRYLPPGIPLGWTVEAGGCARHCVLRAHRRPLMHIDEAAMTRQRNKKNHRQNYNRLGRVGDVRFEQVRGNERFDQVFDTICRQYDFRQGALHRQTPFRDDPRKKPFYFELHRRGLLHTTILTVNGELAASQLGLVSPGRALHLGINSHAPAFAAHSPGSLLLAMLGVHLAREGIPLFDLTPGGDAYKEHFATGHDLVFELAAYAGRTQRLKVELPAGAARAAKALLGACGLRGAHVRLAVDTARRSWQMAWRRAAGQAHAAQPRLSPESAGRACPPERKPGETGVSRNSVADALQFDARCAPLGYWQFLRLAMERMERSHDLYSLVRDGRLMVFCWLAAGSATLLPHELQQLAAHPHGAMLLFDMYVHPEAAKGEFLRGFIDQVLSDLQNRGGSGHLDWRCEQGLELSRAIEELSYSALQEPCPMFAAELARSGTGDPRA